MLALPGKTSLQAVILKTPVWNVDWNSEKLFIWIGEFCYTSIKVPFIHLFLNGGLHWRLVVELSLTCLRVCKAAPRLLVSWLTDTFKRRQHSGSQKGDNLLTQSETTVIRIYSERGSGPGLQGMEGRKSTLTFHTVQFTPLLFSGTVTCPHPLLLRFPLMLTRSGITGKGPPPVPGRSKQRQLD